MKVTETKLSGVLLIEPDVFKDPRGFFMETWNQSRYEEHGVRVRFVQDNISQSSKGVLRGMHIQHPNTQGKLIYVLQGEIFDVAVDLRLSSPTFGRWTSAVLNSQVKRQLYVPEGLAHGFCVLSETVLVGYKVTDVYNPQAEFTLLWNDPDVGIDWPMENMTLSAKDQQGLPLKKIPETRLVHYKK